MAWFLLISEFLITANRIYWKRENDYTNNRIYLTEEDMDNSYAFLDQFDGSGDFLFGVNIGSIDQTSFDTLNNPYIEWNAFTFEWSLNKLKFFELEHCSDEYTEKILGPTLKHIYS